MLCARKTRKSQVRAYWTEGAQARRKISSQSRLAVIVSREEEEMEDVVVPFRLQRNYVYR